MFHRCVGEPVITGANTASALAASERGFSKAKTNILQGNKPEEVIKLFFIKKMLLKFCNGCNLQSLSTDHQGVVIVTTKIPQSWYVPSDGQEIWDT